MLALKNFKLVLLGSAILIGLLYAAPQLLIKRAVEKSGGVYLASQYTLEANELEMDLPRAREIYDGHFPPSELFLNNKKPTPLNPLPVALLSLPIFLFKGNINSAYLAAQFIFSALVFLAFCFAGWVITKNKLWSIFLGFVGALTPLARYIPTSFSGWDNFLNIAVKNFYPLVQSPLELIFLHKVVDPLITFVIFIPALASLIWFWINPKKSTAILAGLLSGLMFYTYWHYWVYLVIVLGLLSVYSYRQRKIQPERWQAILQLFQVIILLAIPYFVNYFLFQRLPDSPEIIARQGVIEHGRYFRTYGVLGHYLFYLVTAAVVYFVFWKKEKRDLAVLYWSFLVAIFAAWNIQLAAGYTLVANHWWLAFAPAGLIILFAIIHELAGMKVKSEKLIKLAISLLIALLIVKKVVNILAFVNPSGEIINKYSFNKDIFSAWEWMNKNLPKEPKVISPLFVDSMYLTIYTSLRPYLPFYTNTLVSNSELEERFLVSQKLFGVSRDNLEKELQWTVKTSEDCEFLEKNYHRRDLVCYSHTRYSFENGRFLYGFYYLPKEFHTVGPLMASWDIPETKIQELLNRYDKLNISWQGVDADYIYYGPWEKNLASIDLRKDKGLELVYQNRGVQIYKVIK